MAHRPPAPVTKEPVGFPQAESARSAVILSVQFGVTIEAIDEAELPPTDLAEHRRPAVKPGRSAAIVTTPASPKRPFNLSLEGLRGVAAVLVVVAHTLPNAGGFTLGVDVFFVLSGFLITRLVVEEFALRGTVSLRSFYIRRGFRLFPALFLFLAVVLVWAQVFAPASGVQIVHSTVLSSLLYVENWHIVAVGGVGGVGLIRDPAAQAWSLSVEEQFYVVWPIILIMAWKLRGPRTALILAACGATLSVAESIGFGFLGATVVRVFMGSDTRAGQLLAACCVALLAQCHLLPRIPLVTALRHPRGAASRRLWCIRRGRARVTTFRSPMGDLAWAHTARRSSILR